MKICQPHGAKLVRLLNEHGLGDKISKTHEELDQKIAAGECDPAVACSRNLHNLALYVCGESVTKGNQCPVCAIMALDLIKYSVVMLEVQLEHEAALKAAGKVPANDFTEKNNQL